MSFTSITFAIFCGAALVLYWLVPRKGWQNIILLAASLIFYAWIQPWYAVLMGVSTIVDYFLAKAMFKARERTRLFSHYQPGHESRPPGIL